MLGEVAINAVETDELLAIYDDTTTRYHAAKTGVERRLIFVDWAARIADFLAKHPQSPYFPGASLQLADYHARILNQSGARQYAETAWMATRERSEPAARQIARESAFLLANQRYPAHLSAEVRPDGGAVTHVSFASSLYGPFRFSSRGSLRSRSHRRPLHAGQFVDVLGRV
jgi:hypothetical protein